MNSSTDLPSSLQSTSPQTRTPVAAARSARQPYQTPCVTPLGEWTALTLANSAPVMTSLPSFFNQG